MPQLPPPPPSPPPSPPPPPTAPPASPGGSVVTTHAATVTAEVEGAGLDDCDATVDAMCVAVATKIDGVTREDCSGTCELATRRRRLLAGLRVTLSVRAPSRPAAETLSTALGAALGSSAAEANSFFGGGVTVAAPPAVGVLAQHIELPAPSPPGLGIDNEVMSEFHSADTNEDGELQYDEFKRLVGHLTDDESLQA